MYSRKSNSTKIKKKYEPILKHRTGLEDGHVKRIKYHTLR